MFHSRLSCKSDSRMVSQFLCPQNICNQLDEQISSEQIKKANISLVLSAVRTEPRRIPGGSRSKLRNSARVGSGRLKTCSGGSRYVHGGYNIGFNSTRLSSISSLSALNSRPLPREYLSAHLRTEGGRMRSLCGETIYQAPGMQGCTGG